MEKDISLKDTTNFLINCISDTKRLKDSSKVLGSLDIPFTRFEAIKHKRSVVGCGMSHLSLLSKIKPGTLILEDDIAGTSVAQNVMHYPEEADAIYLGVSNHGYIRVVPIGHRHTVLATQYSPNWKRVFNMCSTHAILYLTQSYINTAKQVIESCLENDIAFDVGLASIHRHFNILTPNDPWFYQTGQEAFTNLTLEV